MPRHALLTLAAAAALTVSTSAVAQTGGPTMSTANATGRVAVNGVELHYEIHGEGAPLVLLHGGVSPSEMFGAPLAEMSRRHRVIAVHLRGHGLSSDADVPWSCELMADDVAALLDSIGVGRADVMGYSLGGGVALQLAIRHPAKVRRLVAISIAFRSEGGNYPEVREAFERMPAEAEVVGRQIAASPLATLYPDVDWVRMMRKTGEMNRLPHDWSREVAAITAPTLLIFGDADSILLEHMIEFYKLLGGGQRAAGLGDAPRPASRFAVIPNATHFAILGSPAVTQFATDFLAE
ncbi:MAG TPA: alpha/beta hydrolase [Gemmatimonadales bacterium]